MTEYGKIKPDTIARTVVFGLTLINQALAIIGKDKIAFVENDVYQLVSLLVTAVVSIRVWWKNNSFTKAARAGDTKMEEFKLNEKVKTMMEKE